MASLRTSLARPEHGIINWTTNKKTNKGKMKLFSRLVESISIRDFRRQLASVDSVPQFAILGIFSGLLTGLVIVAFRLAIETPLGYFLPGSSENFEDLGLAMTFVYPFVGGLILAAGLSLVRSDSRRVGVVHVLERLARFQGHLPFRNLATQFVAGTLALASGQTGGREGPAVHLGAASSSLLGQYLSLPNNSIRILVGCGAAAAISASFNTPVAGVIFSMEVIIMEYTIAGFIPVILAAVSAALVMQLFHGDDPAFVVPPVAMESYVDLPLLLVLGLLVGCVSALFVHLVRRIYSYAPKHVAPRMIIAGTLTAVLALAVPEILGIGYDTVDDALLGDIALFMLLAILTLKLIATSVTVAMGMPVGLIGPTLFMGAMTGGALWAGVIPVIDNISSAAFYVMLGMGAMMGAVLQAPLAALMAVMELTHNPNIILPAMLVIIVANITANQVFGVRSIFTMQMEMMGLEFRQNPLSMALNRASVASIMSRSFERVPHIIDVERATTLARAKPVWLLVDIDKSPTFIMRAEDLATYMTEKKPQQDVNLRDVPATRKDVTSVMLQATLGEALEKINASGVQALYVNRISAPLMDAPIGILTREDIESYYQR